MRRPHIRTQNIRMVRITEILKSTKLLSMSISSICDLYSYIVEIADIITSVDMFNQFLSFSLIRTISKLALL